MKIELLDIKKYFGPVRANDGITLTVEPGTIHGLLGENGAGKTTLMKVLTGFISADGGEIRLDGNPVHFRSPAESIRHGVGMLHQDPLDFPPLKVIDNLLLAFDDRLVPNWRKVRRSFSELSRRFNFSLDPGARVDTLTVGERQQLEILRLLALGAEVIILDEPTTGISAPQKVLLFATLRRLVTEENKSVIFVSHKLEEVEELCDRVTVLRQGKVTGHIEAPFSKDQLVQLMFGQSLPQSERPSIELGDPILELQDVTVQTYRLTVPHMSLTVRAGEVIGLAGLEGSGQRLMLQACVGLQRASSGRIRLAGSDFTRRSYRDFLAAGVAYLPAGRIEEGLIRGLTLTEHYVLSQRERQPVFIDWAAARDSMQQKVTRFNIRGTPDTPVEALSGGNQQRALLSLLPPDLRLLAMEHPTRGLDIESAMWVWEQLLERRRDGTAILFISADLDELMEYSDRIVVFSDGKMARPINAATTSVEELGYLIGGVQAEA
ncbi:MAG: ATP-binding cassette domain-containing protein [Anaerolineae bacterium]